MAELSLGLLTAIGGYIEVGSLSTSAEAGARFGLSLLWPLALGTVALILLSEMSGRFAAVSKTAYMAAVREHFGFKLYLVPLATAIVTDTLLLAAEVGGVATGLTLGLRLPFWLALVLAALVVWAALWFLSFQQMERWPTLLGLLSLAFVAGIVLRGGPSPPLLSTLWHLSPPRSQLGQYLFLTSAVLGATISPYLVVFYSSGARQEGWGRHSLWLNRTTAVAGIGAGAVLGAAVLVLAAIVLGPSHQDVSSLTGVESLLLGSIGGAARIVFPVLLFVTCLGASLEVCLALSFNVAQGFGWPHALNARHRDAARFRVTMLVVLAGATTVALIVRAPLTLALFASALMALVLPVALFPFLVIMNDPDHLGEYTNGPAANVATLVILLLASVVALCTIPLLIVGGGQ